MGIGSSYYNAPSASQVQDWLANLGYVQPAKQPSMIDAMVARANQATQNVNVPTLANLFPYMNYQAPNMGMMNPGMGAGRFLGKAPTVSSGTPAIPFNFNVPT